MKLLPPRIRYAPRAHALPIYPSDLEPVPDDLRRYASAFRSFIRTDQAACKQTDSGSPDVSVNEFGHFTNHKNTLSDVKRPR